MNDCPGEFYDENDYNDLNLTVIIFHKKDCYLLCRREFDTMIKALNYAQTIVKDYTIISIFRKNYPCTV